MKRIVRWFVVLAVAGLALGGTVAGLVAFGTVEPLPPRPELAQKLTVVDYRDLPAAQGASLRDGREMPFRRYEGVRDAGAPVAVLIHGSSGSSRTMHALARDLARSGIAVYAVDVRGHGAFPPRGDIAYIGQTDDDLADFLAFVRRGNASRPIVVIGHSAGGGLALRFAAGPYGELAAGYVLLAPFFHYTSKTTRTDGGWAAAHVGRVMGLSLLDFMGITRWHDLPALEFAVPPAWRAAVTPVYSYRLMRDMQAGPDFRHQLAGAKRPLFIIAGRDDELLRVEAYAEEAAGGPAPTIRLLDGVDHIGLIVDPPALAAVRAAVRAAAY